MPTFADLPLSTRAAAAVNAIGAHALTIPQRCELVAPAIWPTPAVLPGAVKRGPRLPDIDLRPPRPRARRGADAHAPEPARRAGVPDPAVLRDRLSRGDTLSSIAAEYGVPWLTARAWARGRS